MPRSVRVGLIGSQFISSLHAEALRVRGRRTRRGRLSHGRAFPAFAARLGIPRVFTEYRRLVECQEVDLIVLGAPNDLHCPMTLAAAAAGKHVSCEKPLCLNLAEADVMIAACRQAGVKLMYAEELCFAPKYVRLKQLLDEVALGSTRRTSGTSTGLAAAPFRNPGKGV